MPTCLQVDLVLPVTSSPCTLPLPLWGPSRAHSGSHMDFSERLKLARERRDINQTQLADFLGVSAQTVQQWESGKTMPRHKRVNALARHLRVREQWLMFGQGPMLEGGDELTFHDTEIVEESGPLRPDEVDLPCFREVEFSAGDGRSQVIENHGHSMRFSLARLARARVKPENGACATASGSSMEPTIVDGSPIAIDKGCRHVIDGKIYALDHGGMLRVKRLYKLPLGRVRLVSDNADEYPEEVCSLMGEDAPRIIGRVFWWEVFD